MNKHLARWLAILLASLTLLGSAAALAGCGENTENPTGTQAGSETGTAAPNQESDTVEEDHRFDDIHYGGEKPFRVYTSTNIASPGMGNSNFLIEGTNEAGGGIVNDAVLARNIKVEELLGIKLEFTQVDKPYTDVPADIRTLTTAGIDEFDLVINDLFPFANLSIEGQFRNILNEDCVFDFERSYWYGDYMEDLRLMDGYQHLLAGDYFIDIMRSAHLLLMNKQIYEDNYQRNPDEIYDVVLNYEWTFEKMNNIISGIYNDKNSNGNKDKGDLFGFITLEYWGGSIAYTISGNPHFMQRDEDGIPEIILGVGDRSNQLAAAMSAIFNNDCSSVAMTGDTELLQAFANDECLIIDYQRLGSLENEILRSMEGDCCVLPYPMLFSSDRKYTTSAHDTTELGAILTTSTDLEYISTVVEVLNRETASVVMPKYYKDGLQVQLVDDSKGAQMIDIIHDNFDNSFALAFNEALGGKMLQSFSNAMQQKREFSAVYAKSDKLVNRTLGQKISQFERNNKE